MEKLVLSTESRDLNVKLSELRSNKKVPSVVYGHKFPSANICVDNSEFLKVFRKGGYTHLVELTVDGKKHNALIHEVQRHPVSGDFLHVDFFVVSAKEKLTVNVPVVLVGESQAQKEGAVLEQNLHTIEIKCLPADLIDTVEVDVSSLEKIGDIVHVSAIKLDKNKYEILTPEDGAIVSAHQIKEHKAEEVVAPVAEVEAPAEEAKSE